MADSPDIERIDEICDCILTKYPDETGRLINVLNDIQDLFGFVPEEAFRAIASKTDTDVSALVDFAKCFAGYALEREGDHVVEVCDGTACHMCGSQDVVKALENASGVPCGTTAADGRITLKTVHCVGACNLAPVVKVDDEVRGRIKISKAAQLLKDV